MELETPIFELPFLELPEATTAELVLAAQAGDNEAFGTLVNRFERMVQAVCWQRLRGHAMRSAFRVCQ